MNLLVLLLTVTVFFANPGRGASQEPEYNWYSEPKNPAAIGFDIVTLYVSLREHNALPLEQYEDRDGKPVVDIMRDRSHFAGPVFPLALDRLLCELNRHVCKVVNDPKAGAPRFVWSGGVGTTYTLPAVTFDSYRTPNIYQKKSGELVPDIVVNKVWGCVRFDQACRDVIAHLNPSLKNPFDPSYAGPLVLPTFAVKTRVDGLEALKVTPNTPTAAQQAAGQATPQIQKQAADEQRKKVLREEAIHELYRSGKTADKPASTQSIQKNIPSSSPYRIESSHLPDFHYGTHQQQLFRLIRHPLDQGSLDPGVYRNKVVVAVIDGWVDPTHCEFVGAGAVQKFKNRPRPAPPSDASPAPINTTCADPVVDGVPTDHGTHVAGLIAAKINGIGIVGINPFAHIVTYEADDSQPFAVGQLVDDAVTVEGARIVNISMTTPVTGNDPVLDRINRLKDSVLFVAAAGNQGLPVDDQCSLYPACYHKKPNVITVVALDSNADAPGVWTAGQGRGSNSGTSFHLGVPATGIVSSAVGGQYRRLTGSSQAAPIVTATASLIYMQKQSLSPLQVKERLIYTSEFFSQLRDKIFGGRLNIERALAIDEDVIVKTNNGILRGTVRKQNVSFFYTAFADAEETKIPLRFLKRIIRDPAGGAFPFTVLDVVSRDGARELERHFDVKARETYTLTMKVRLPGGATRTETVRLDEIADYTSALAEE
jgi:subtilisin family serine protease